jgi:membrane associated rhomboid family serine protease
VLTTRIVSFRQAAFLAAAFTILLWMAYLVDSLLLPASVKPGIYPRTPIGLIGIALAPLVHGSFGHLVSNTLPVFLLGSGMIYLYPRSSRLSLPFLYLAPGIGVWLFAREAYHIGASGLSYGMMFFLLVIGMLRKDRASVAFSMVVLFLYGGMLAGLLPDNSGISFEYHLFGALTGAACAFILRNRDPLPAAKSYSWEDESEHESEFDDLDDTDFRD